MKKTKRSTIQPEAGRTFPSEVVRPEYVITQLYELSIDSCRKRDTDKAKRAVGVLIDALDFDYAEVAQAFYDVYQLSLSMISDGRFEQAASVLSEVRDVWTTAVLATESDNKLNREVMYNGR